MDSCLSRRWLLLCLACGSLLWPAVATAQQFVVEPYLQAASPTGMWVAWETSSGRESVVSFGTSDKLDREARGTVTRGPRGSSRFHLVKLEGLTPNTRYFYKAKSGKLASGTFDMRTPSPPSAERRTRIVAIADSQWDFRHGDKLEEITEQGILRFAAARNSPALSIDMLLVAGDLVKDGRDHRDWTQHFFAPLRKLMRHVPTYP
jgi:phosphodiesterase/alkaline phosphatase D-like protein